LPREPAWEDLSAEQQKREARMMEIYAAMVSDLDRYVGKVVDYLKAIGEFDNTVIFFMSDNGAEGHHLEKGWAELARWVDECCDNSYENMGRPDSYLWYGPNWGRVSVGPWRMFKGFTTEGGIKVPAFIRSPELAGGRINHGVLTVMDVMPTLLELAGVEHPGTHYRGREVVPMQGSSMLSMLRGTTDSTHGPDYVMGWELFGKRAIRKGDWKIVQEPEGDLWSERNPLKDPYRWRLFNLTEDPAELNDVSAAYPEKLKELVAHWEEYARRNGVIIPDHVTGY
jgi:arylsulfatase